MGEGEGGMIWENGIEKCIISYVKQKKKEKEKNKRKKWKILFESDLRTITQEEHLRKPENCSVL